MSMLAAAFDKRVFQELAVIMQEIALGFNIVITPVFWTFLAPHCVYEPFAKGDYFVVFMMTIHHTFPIISSLANLGLNKQYLLKKDRTVLFWAAFLYVPVNYWGTMHNPEPVYPYPADWSNFVLSFTLYFIQAPLMYWLHGSLADET